MKKFTLLLSIILAFSFFSKVVAAPVLTDEIPQDYIKQVKSQKKLNYDIVFSDYDKKNSLPVKIYSPENIRIQFTQELTNFNLNYTVTNIKINDCFTFLVAEDVYKDGKLFISKGTPASGYVEKVQISASNYGPPPEFKISNFSTKDVNNREIKLKGSVLNDYSGFLQIISHGVNKNKIYTLYFK